MRYRISRITYGSALKIGLALGWLVALLPALCLSWLAVRVLEQVNNALVQVKPVQIQVLGQVLMRFDTLQELQLASIAQTIGRLTLNPTTTFLWIALILTLAGAALIVAGVLLFCVGYNIVAALGGGIVVETEDDPA